MFEKRVLTRVFGSRRDEVTGEWRKLHNEELVLFNKQTNKQNKLHGLSP
jgi:hypothetical protein